MSAALEIAGPLFGAGERALGAGGCALGAGGCALGAGGCAPGAGEDGRGATLAVSAFRAPAAQLSSRARDLLELAKPRIAVPAVATMGIGYALAGGAVSGRLAAAVFGTTLLGAGASCLNMVWERESDARMARTASRPLAAGRLSVRLALALGVAACVLGTVALWSFANPLAGWIGAISAASYVLAYTPLKRVTSVCTLVGAVPGALPPLIGWAAATGHLDRFAWTVFALQFLWQLPHFLAIGWLYRDDYARAGMPVLPVVDRSGRATGRQAVLYAAALLVVGVLPWVYGWAGPLYLVAALALGIAYLVASVRQWRRRSRRAARWLFLVSMVHLPVVLTALALSRAPADPLAARGLPEALVVLTLCPTLAFAVTAWLRTAAPGGLATDAFGLGAARTAEAVWTALPAVMLAALVLWPLAV